MDRFTGMYFCYIDESGDCGAFDAAMPNKTGSPYFILAGLIVPTKDWKSGLDVFKAFRRKLAAQCYLPYDVEVHCAEMIDSRKTQKYNQTSIADRWMIIEEFAEKIGSNSSCSIVAIVIDKKESQLRAEEYLTTCITKLYQAFDQFLKEKDQLGIMLFDRANDRIVQTHVRKLLGTGSSGESIPGVKIKRIIEDAFFRISSDSIFIQAADVIAFTLKEKEFPLASRKKFYADMIFKKKLSKIIYASIYADNNGIIRL